MAPQSVAVVGLGRVGLPLALSFADRGLDVIGVEKEQSVLDSLAGGTMPFAETGTQELLERVLDAAEADYGDALRGHGASLGRGAVQAAGWARRLPTCRAKAPMNFGL